MTVSTHGSDHTVLLTMRLSGEPERKSAGDAGQPAVEEDGDAEQL